MLTAAIVIVVLAVGLVAGAGGMAARAEWGVRTLSGQRMIVTVRDDLPFVGYLTHRGHRTYIFEHCHTLPGPGETADPIAGRVVIDRPAIAYMQHVITGVDLPPAPNAKVSDVSQ